jgi:hypothetical protein
MRFILCIVVSILAMGCANAKSHEGKTNVMRIVNSVPMVICGENIGSAVLYQQGGATMAVTAAHVLVIPELCGPLSPEQETAPMVVSIAGWNYQTDKVEWVSAATVLLKNDSLDFAILLLDSSHPNMSFASMSKHAAEFGEEVYMAGCPMADAASLSRGIVSHPSRDPVVGNPGNTRYIQTDASGYYGSSGGGLFRKSDGSCIGIVVMRNPSYSSMYALKITEIAEKSNGLIILSD